MNRKKLLTIVIIVNMVITALSFVLGCLMYSSNSKSIFHNTVYVQMTDFIADIEYGLHFGKSLESYYGMEGQLNSALDVCDNVDGLYIVSNDHGLLFKTDERILSPDIRNLAAGSDKKSGNELWCAFSLTDDAVIISRSDITKEIHEWRAYYLHLGLVCLTGFIVSAGLMFVIWKMSNYSKGAYAVLIVLLSVWIVIIGSYVGYCAYTAYLSSIEGLDEMVTEAIYADIDRVHKLGVRNENITGMNSYLRRYTDNIPELQKIVQDHNSYEVVISRTYLKRVAIDYLLQTVLFLAFSLMLVTEYQIFISRLDINPGEGDESEGA